MDEKMLAFQKTLFHSVSEWVSSSVPKFDYYKISFYEV